MAVILGDIVSHAGLKWVVTELRGGASGWPPDAVLSRKHENGCGYTSLVVRSDGPELVERIVFIPGQKIRVYDGGEGVVISDNGGPLVQVQVTRRRQTQGNQHITSTGICDTQRGRLLIDNYL